MPGVSRRRFLAGSAAAGLSVAWPAFSDDRPMPKRALGATGVRVSLAGLGCYQLGQRAVSEKDAAHIVHRALDLGVDYIDTAASYGESEERVGKALRKRRDEAFLTTKTLARDAAGARRELATSLKRLRTDRIDLWQFHSLRSKDDTDRILAKDGALAEARAAQKAGKVRFVGITGHYDPTVFVEALERHPFDTLLIPLNAADRWHRSFEENALPAAAARKTGLVAMKVYCAGGLTEHVKAEECLRYTFGLPIATCIVGCGHVAEIELAAHVARHRAPMNETERAELRKKTKGLSPGLERYKAR